MDYPEGDVVVGVEAVMVLLEACLQEAEVPAKLRGLNLDRSHLEVLVMGDGLLEVEQVLHQAGVSAKFFGQVVLAGHVLEKVDERNGENGLFLFFVVVSNVSFLVLLRD